MFLYKPANPKITSMKASGIKVPVHFNHEEPKLEKLVQAGILIREVVEEKAPEPVKLEEPEVTPDPVLTTPEVDLTEELEVPEDDMNKDLQDYDSSELEETQPESQDPNFPRKRGRKRNS